jgi:hypothetical protein
MLVLLTTAENYQDGVYGWIVNLFNDSVSIAEVI